MGFAIETIIQILVIIFITHAAVYSYRIAQWSCATSVQFLTAGFVYILAWRVIFFSLHFADLPTRVWVETHQTYFIVPAYAMFAWGLYLLYKTLANLGR